MPALSSAKEAAFEKVRGLWIAIPTPFTQDGEIDEGALRKAVDYYIDGLEVDGIFCGGVMGEFWSMTLEERARCHELVVGAAAGRVPIMAHIGHHVYSEAAHLSRHAEEIGADFVIAMNPYFPLNPTSHRRVVRAPLPLQHVLLRLCHQPAADRRALRARHRLWDQEPEVDGSPPRGTGAGRGSDSGL
jgi:hypothetical protein